MLILNVLVYCWSLCTVLHLQPHPKQLSEQFACLYLKGKSSGLFFFFFLLPLAGILGNFKQLKYQLTYGPLTLSWKCQAFIFSILMNSHQLF